MSDLEPTLETLRSMQDSKFFSLGLPKWPRLLVKGEKVTKEQAQEILIRTDNWFFSGNDPVFEKALKKASGLRDQLKDEGWTAYNAHREKVLNSYRVLSLEYLYNSQVLTCWYGGPHGWCNWDGEIFSNNYNIGKWPNVKDIYEEWVSIAEAFPYLDLRCQLLSGEGEEKDFPVVEFVIKDGKVQMIEPIELLLKSESENSDLWNVKGCTLKQYKAALEVVRSEPSSIEIVQPPKVKESK